MVVLIMTGVFASASLLSSILIREIKSLRVISDASRAFYAADSGVEWKMYEIFRDTVVSGPVMENGSSCCQIDCGGGVGQACQAVERFGLVQFMIKSVGSATTSYDVLLKRGIETNLR
jgi:hypothetical protein